MQDSSLDQLRGTGTLKGLTLTIAVSSSHRTVNFKVSMESILLPSINSSELTYNHLNLVEV